PGGRLRPAPERPLERPGAEGPVDARRRVPAEPGTPPRMTAAHGQPAVGAADHPGQLVRRAPLPAPDAGPGGGYAGPPSEAPPGPGSPSDGALTSATGGAAAGTPASASAGADSSDPAGAGSDPAGAASAPSTPWDHSAAETAVPPSAGCHTISPASFWTHS